MQRLPRAADCVGALMHSRTIVVVQRLKGLGIEPVRAFNFNWAGIDSIETALSACTVDVDDLLVIVAEAGLEVEEDPAEEAPWDVRPDVLMYAEQDAVVSTRI